MAEGKQSGEAPTRKDGDGLGVELASVGTSPAPVPLDEIEAAAREATDGPWHQMAAAAWSGTNESPDLVADCPLYADAIHIATADPLTVAALTKALRIAVEGLDRVDDECAMADGMSECYPGEPICPPCRTRAALAAVRELVDLGGDK